MNPPHMNDLCIRYDPWPTIYLTNIIVNSYVTLSEAFRYYHWIKTGKWVYDGTA